MRTVIIGGVAGGATAAARLRRRDEKMEITIFERGSYISYAGCGLPFYIGDVIKERDKLLLMTPDKMKRKFNVDVHINSEVLEIDRKHKKLKIKDLLQGDVYEEAYDKLIIATGSEAFRPALEGLSLPGIYTVSDLSDADAIREALSQPGIESALVVGGGFIGLEMADNLKKRGLEVALVEAGGQILSNLDKDMACLIEENAIDNGISLYLNDSVQSFTKSGSFIETHLKSGRSVSTDIVIFSVGVRPNSALAAKAGLEINARKSIVVDEHLRTSDEDIYAVGDVIGVEDLVLGGKKVLPLAGPANKQARIAADNIMGDNKVYKGNCGTAIVSAFDLTIAYLGHNERALKAAGKKRGEDYYSIVINQKSHAAYYPGAFLLTLKMHFSPEGEILGVQVIGADNVVKCIDAIASVMHFGGTAMDLEELELAYAPAFSSPKSPVNMLGFVAENVLRRQVEFIDCEEADLLRADTKKCEVIDVTEPAEFEAYHLEGAKNIPLGTLRQRLGELDREKAQIVYCAAGVRGYAASCILRQNGFKKVYLIYGGTAFYRSFHYADKKPSPKPSPGQKKTPEAGEGTKDGFDKELDCTGLSCPGPIMRISKAMEKMEEGQILRAFASDLAFSRDVRAWCERTGNAFLSGGREGEYIAVRLQKGGKEARGEIVRAGGDDKTIIVFSDDLDRAFASFIIANGAASMGKKVTMFFTFWGLNILRRNPAPHVEKSFMSAMFAKLMPRGSENLTISKLNMGGVGTKLMKDMMRQKNVPTLESLIEQAQQNGIKFIACTMTMDVMGIQKEELIDGVELGGVASYLGQAETSNVNLFI